MSNIKERLDRVRELVQDNDFLEGKGLSNEVNIRIFCYDPEDEMTVRHFINQISADHTLSCHLIECSLFKMFLKVCDDLGITDAISEMEQENGSDFLLEQLRTAIGESDFIEQIKKREPQQGDVLLLTGVGEVFPFMRIHTLLEAIQPHFSNLPILVMYPGNFDNHQVRLFKRLKPNDYYRAFNVI